MFYTDKGDNYFQNQKITLMEQIHTKEVSMHNHYFFELVYVVDGGANHIMSGNRTRLKQGDYFIIDYLENHKYICNENESIKIINCIFRPEFIDKTLRGCEQFSDIMRNYLIQFSPTSMSEKPTTSIFHDDGTVFSILKRMCCELEEKKAGYIELLRCMLIEILVLTLRSIYILKDIVSIDWVTQYVLDKVNEDFTSEIILSDICKEINYSLPYVSRRFKENIGISFTDYLQKLRIEYCCRLISNNNKKVYEAAELCGYTDLKFFNKIFKKWIGLTPSEYKKLSYTHLHEKTEK